MFPVLFVILPLLLIIAGVFALFGKAAVIYVASVLGAAFVIALHTRK